MCLYMCPDVSEYSIENCYNENLEEDDTDKVIEVGGLADNSSLLTPHQICYNSPAYQAMCVSHTKAQ